MGGVNSQTKTHLALAGTWEPGTFTIVSTALDAGNTGQTHILRRGLVLGRVTASGKLVEYDDDGTDDGRRIAFAILIAQVDLKDGDPAATAADHACSAFRVGQDIITSNLIGIDANGILDLEAVGCNFVA
jgi:Bacteriophage lambda head decoration protein D